jgi:signal transduction histidine kinase
VNPELVTSVVAAAVELTTAVIFALAYARMRSERDLGVACLLALAASAHALGFALAPSRPALGGASFLAENVAWVGLVASGPLSLHFACRFSAPRHAASIVTAGYGAATASALTLALGEVLGRPTPPRMAAYAVLLATALTDVAIMGRALVSGQHAALLVTCGAALFSLAIVHDMVRLGRLLATPQLVDVGLGLLLLTVASTGSERYVSLSKHLEHRTRELRARTEELRRSYEDLRTAQEELVKKEQLAVVGELAAVIAHEVRNPLAIIANAVSGLRKQAISRVDHDTLLTIMDEEASRLNRLVQDLLRYARPVNVQRTHFSLIDVLQRAAGQSCADHPGIRTAFEYECDEARIWGDANLLRQVFDNLTDNAVQAMDSEGTLTLRLRATEMGDAPGLAVDVIDTGEGMDAQVRSRARDPFFTTRPSGTGLGLAIVERIVVAHGGHLVIDSRAGEGTTVTVFLPYGSAEDGPISGQAIRRGSGRPERTAT